MNHDARLLEDLLDREIELARRLAGVLADERVALTGRSHEAVTAKAAEKCEVLGALEKLETERRDLCAATGQPLPPLAPNPPADGLASSVTERWRSLMGLIAACSTANEVNGRIVHIRQVQTRQLIDIVRGGPPVTYGPRGKTFATALRALARA